MKTLCFAQKNERIGENTELISQGMKFKPTRIKIDSQFTLSLVTTLLVFVHQDLFQRGFTKMGSKYFLFFTFEGT